MSIRCLFAALRRFFLIILLLPFLLTSCNSRQTQETVTEAPKPEPRYLFDIQIDSLEVIQKSVGKNQFLTDILMQYNVDYPTIEHLVKNFKHTFDVRRLKAGNNYFVMLGNDSLRSPKYFVYEINPADYVVYSLSDSLFVYRGSKQVETKMESAHGMITSSLWNAMVGNGYDADLAIKMSDVYAWTIDFFGIQKNDRFEVIYERKYIDDKPVGIGRIISARFNHNSKDFFAFYFEQEGEGDYFDEVGQSLQRAFLKAPLKYSRISSHFSNNRFHPVLKYARPHHGVDYAAPSGTPVYAIGQGTVTRKGFQGGGASNFLYIKHNSTYTTAYMHLQKFAPGMREGARVQQGELIGYVGSTGLATGPHLDFRFFKNNQPVNPLTVESPPAKPVNSKYQQAYQILVDVRTKELHNLIETINLAMEQSQSATKLDM